MVPVALIQARLAGRTPASACDNGLLSRLPGTEACPGWAVLPQASEEPCKVRSSGQQGGGRKRGEEGLRWWRSG